MKREKLDMFLFFSRQKSVRILFAVAILYVLLVFYEVPFVFRTVFQEGRSGVGGGSLNSKSFLLEIDENSERKDAPVRPLDVPFRVSGDFKHERRAHEFTHPLASLNFDVNTEKFRDEAFTEMFKSAKAAYSLGRKIWENLEELAGADSDGMASKEKPTTNGPVDEACPQYISMGGDEFSGKRGKLMVLPCGLTLGSHITIVAKPKQAHAESETKISLLKEGQYIMVSQFFMELQGLKAVEGEEPPRIFHFNPRLKGDWSGKSVIEMNTCYRQQWGTPQRCEGWLSKAEEEAVDGLPKCEKWIQDDGNQTEEAKANWWLNRLIGRTKRVPLDWPFPFLEDKLFVLTLSAGLDGYHVHVDGRHITSFPYRTGFALEDATGLTLNGDVNISSIVAASLPTSHPSFSPQRYLNMSAVWKAPPLQDKPVDLFIGILSAGNHFAERMAIRKSWMQDGLIKSSKVVARFMVALNPRKEVILELKRETDFFGDIVIIPYIDHYDLVVLKTVAICEYGVRKVAAKHLLKCDDDTFVKVGAVLEEANKIPQNKSCYIGNINFYHKPLRSGKWAVTYKEWPEEVYPPYANGAGYMISFDIANFIVSGFEKQELRLFKMEDVSMGTWVGQFNTTIRPVEYVHSLKFCQFGCIENYLTAHYQSPRQMLCMWNKLQQDGKPQCCNMR